MKENFELEEKDMYPKRIYYPKNLSLIDVQRLYDNNAFRTNITSLLSLNGLYKFGEDGVVTCVKQIKKQ